MLLFEILNKFFNSKVKIHSLLLLLLLLFDCGWQGKVFNITPRGTDNCELEGDWTPSSNNVTTCGTTEEEEETGKISSWFGFKPNSSKLVDGTLKIVDFDVVEEERDEEEDIDDMIEEEVRRRELMKLMFCWPSIIFPVIKSL